jgi:hypothetical protein
MISARVASLVGFVFAVVFAWLPPSSARAQDGQPFQVWINTAQCSMTRAGWLAVAQDSPGFGWTHSPGSSPQFTMVGALALLDALRINTCQADSTSCPAFKNYCCPVVVWSNPSTGAFSIAKEGDIPGGGFGMMETGPICCEEAVGIAGFDPFGCTSVALMSVPGAVVQMTPTGPVSTTGSTITIPTSPPTVVLSLAGGGGGGGGTHAAGEYLGCFKDPNNPYNLDGFLGHPANNTPEACTAICRDKGFKYAGVEWSVSCLCGDSYDHYGTANNCDMACPGDSSEICGGFGSNSVFATGL